MSLEVKSEGDILEFVHMKKPPCEGTRKCARMSISVSLCAMLDSAYGMFTHTPRQGRAAIGNLRLITAGIGSRAIVT